MVPSDIQISSTHFCSDCSAHLWKQMVKLERSPRKRCARYILSQESVSSFQQQFNSFIIQLSIESPLSQEKQEVCFILREGKTNDGNIFLEIQKIQETIKNVSQLRFGENFTVNCN